MVQGPGTVTLSGDSPLKRLKPGTMVAAGNFKKQRTSTIPQVCFAFKPSCHLFRYLLPRTKKTSQRNILLLSDQQVLHRDEVFFFWNIYPSLRIFTILVLIFSVRYFKMLADFHILLNPYPEYSKSICSRIRSYPFFFTIVLFSLFCRLSHSLTAQEGAAPTTRS